MINISNKYGPFTKFRSKSHPSDEKFYFSPSFSRMRVKKYLSSVINLKKTYEGLTFKINVPSLRFLENRKQISIRVSHSYQKSILPFFSCGVYKKIFLLE